MVNSPHVKRNLLAQVARHDLELGVAVEDTVGHHTEEVKTDALSEARGRSDNHLGLPSASRPVCLWGLEGEGKRGRPVR